MSLVNRMLKDLSTREPTSANVMQGIRLGDAEPPRRSSGPLIALLLLAAIGVGVWWFWPRLSTLLPEFPSTATVAVQPEPATPAPVPAAAPARPLARFVLDESLSAVPVPRPATRRPPPPRAAVADDDAGGQSVLRDSRTALLRFDEGMKALERGDSEVAEQRFADALALDPKLHPAREELGNLRVREERWTDAERSVRRGYEEDASWPGYRRLAARLALARNQPDEAVRQLESQAIPPVSEDPEYSGLLASAYQRVGRHEDASRIYRELVKHQPSQGHWWAGYGISRDALGDRADAVHAYLQSLQDPGLDPRVDRYVRGRLEALKPAGG